MIKSSIKTILKGYNIDFLCEWTLTTNYQIWLNEHDKQLSLQSELVKHSNNVNISYENGDIYSGSLCNGKRHGNGMYSEFSTRAVYNFLCENDMLMT